MMNMVINNYSTDYKYTRWAAGVNELSFRLSLLSMAYQVLSHDAGSHIRFSSVFVIFSHFSIFLPTKNIVSGQLWLFGNTQVLKYTFFVNYINTAN